MNKEKCVSIRHLKECFEIINPPLNFLLETPVASNITVEYNDKLKGRITKIHEEWFPSELQVIDYIRLNEYQGCYLKFNDTQLKTVDILFSRCKKEMDRIKKIKIKFTS